MKTIGYLLLGMLTLSILSIAADMDTIADRLDRISQKLTTHGDAAPTNFHPPGE